MSDHGIARQCCDLLGWTWVRWAAPTIPGLGVLVWDYDGERFAVNVDAEDRRVAQHTVDLPTLATATLLRHAGPVDVGPCPECEGYGRISSGTCPECWLGTDMHGRELVPASEAAFLAESRRCGRCRVNQHGVWCDTCDGSTIITGHEGAREALRQLAEGWREHLPVLADWMLAEGRFDDAARKAQDGWARLERDHFDRAPCLGRWLDSEWQKGTDEHRALGDGCLAVPRPLAECPAVARWVLAWLAGECEQCHVARPWRDRIRSGYRTVAGARCYANTVRQRDGSTGRVVGSHGNYVVHWDEPCEGCDGAGLAIGAHLQAMYAHLSAAWERETVVCPGCKGSGTDADVAAMVQGVRRRGLVVASNVDDDCPACDGLGRIRAEAVT